MFQTLIDSKRIKHLEIEWSRKIIEKTILSKLQYENRSIFQNDRFNQCSKFIAKNLHEISCNFFNTTPEVLEILAWNQFKKIVYIIGVPHGQVNHKHLFEITDSTPIKWVCKTCRINDTILIKETLNKTTKSIPIRITCNYNNAIFSRNLTFYIQECQGPEVPIIFLVNTSDNQRISILNDGLSLRNLIKVVDIPVSKFYEINWNNDHNFYIQLVLPAQLNEINFDRYPLILMTNTKPGLRTVNDLWKVDWSWYLALNKNYIVGLIDGQSAGLFGQKLLSETKNKLGVIDVMDRLNALNCLVENLHFIDKKRICVIGQGYGAFIATMMLAEDFNNLINCSISISPITNWQFHSSFFTEKYMSQANLNAQFFEKIDLTEKTANLLKRNFMLIYGSLDSIVNPQQSILLEKQLVANNIIFRQLILSDQDTFRLNNKLQIYIWMQIEDFFDKVFGKIELNDYDFGSDLFLL